VDAFEMSWTRIQEPSARKARLAERNLKTRPHGALNRGRGQRLGGQPGTRSSHCEALQGSDKRAETARARSTGAYAHVHEPLSLFPAWPP